MNERPPRSALVLGYAGLLPPAAAILLFLYLVHAGTSSGALPAMLLLAALVYAALILSFLGGIWWGVAAARLEGPALRPWLVTAVMPSLVALPAMLAAFGAPRVGGALIGLALIATLLGDRRLAAAGLVPPWWMGLRVPLSCGLALLTMAAGLLA